MNAILRILALCTSLAMLLPLQAFAQYSYWGRTSDLATERPIADVSIFHKRLTIEITSDNNGAFAWDFNNPEKESKFQIVFNMFFSPPEENVLLQLFTVDGKRILQTGKLGQGGTYLLPYLKTGIYILQVVSEHQTETLKLYSNGTEIILLQNLYTHKNSPIRDTVVFSKEGYYSAEIIVPSTDTIIHAKLLAKSENDVNYLNGLPDYNAFNLLQSSPFITNQGDVQSVKFIYSEKENLIYYMNSKRYEIHYFFAEQFLGYKKGHYHFNMTQYSNSGQRYLYPGEINYYKSLNKYVIRFYAGDEMNCNKIQEIFEKIHSSTYLAGKLFLYPNNSKWEECSSIPIITSDELFEGQNYQALNLAEGYGYLRKVKLNELNETYLGKHDIIILSGIPNDVSVVSGIITTEFQTPLSHINILSHNRGTPNMALRDGWTNPKLDSLAGQLIYLNVLADSFVVRKANLEEATSFWQQNEPQATTVLAKDEKTSGLVNLTEVNHSAVNLIGGKAANFAELLKLSNPKIPTPENPFAIPFYYYSQHIKNNQLQTFIEELLADQTFKTDQEYRKTKLEELRNKIIDAPIDPALVNMVSEKIENFKDFDAYRFRSSTNAEDLEFFSGAGLYDSYSAKKDHDTKTIENAIKKVWASLWNFRAFEEREYYKIDHLSTAMGILIHRSFPDEDANGVLITKNLYNINPGFIVNAQFKEYSIVFPEPGVLHDQVILYTYSLSESDNFTIEYLSHSNIEEFKGQNVLTDSELYQLGRYCMHIKKHYFYEVPHSCNCLFDKFGLDIEFKIDSPNGKRKLYIKQVRLYQ
ncbi:PEP/pyruvate-binding domain-containing protein [Maribellus maritimus]|uniref:PEP/pyruvate-binding domain-containing protein n=1 Tax=Maribellus maritimus TaxID=2870838 RepID=UPI001EEA5EB7|nr:PEP/pyruvate-binding domain-containing protein [Maribellus maritimus]MCG6186010.1 T9SS type A sorting domain-containing protein [Maribellus maritimus]